MNKARQLTFGFLIAFGALYYTLRNVSAGEVMTSFQTVEWFYLIPSVVIILMSYVVHAFRWQILLLSIRKVKVSSLYSPIMVGAMGNILPGRPGEILRAYLLGKKQDLPISGVLATILIERLFDLIILLVLFTWVLLFHAEVFSSRFTYSGSAVEDLAAGFGKLTGGLLGVLVILIYFMVFHQERLRKWVREWSRRWSDKWRNRIEKLIEEFSLGLQSIRDAVSLVKITLFSILENGANIFAFYPLYWAYGLHDKSLASLLILMVLVTILIVTLPTPAFLGSFNAGVLIALHEISGEAEVTAVSFGMVSWSLNFLVIFVTGLFFLLRDHLSLPQLLKAKEKEVDWGGEKLE